MLLFVVMGRLVRGAPESRELAFVQTGLPAAATMMVISVMPPWLRFVARVMPLTYAVSLLRGLWRRDALASHLRDAGIIALFTVVFTALASRVFRWE